MTSAVERGVRVRTIRPLLHLPFHALDNEKYFYVCFKTTAELNSRQRVVKNAQVETRDHYSSCSSNDA